MSQLRVERLSGKFSIVKDHLWCIYDGDHPLFHGSANECRDWLDRHEAMPLDIDPCSPSARSDSQPTFWQRLFRRAQRTTHLT